MFENYLQALEYFHVLSSLYNTINNFKIDSAGIDCLTIKQVYYQIHILSSKRYREVHMYGKVTRMHR